MDAKVPRWVRWLPRPGWAGYSVFALLLAVILVAWIEGLYPSRPARVFVWSEGDADVCVQITSNDGLLLLEKAALAGANIFRVDLVPAPGPPPPFVSMIGARHRILSASPLSAPTQLTPEELFDVTSAIAAWGRESAERPQIAAPGESARVSPRRVAWNVAMGVLVLIAPLAIIRFVIESVAESRRDRHLQRLRRGVCPKCQYSIAGLQQESCPECGEVIPRDSIGAATVQPSREQPGAQA